MSGAYWGLCALEILNAGDRMDKEELVEWVKQCQNEDGGFGGNLNHDSNLVYLLFFNMIVRYTLSALQILAICDKMDVIDKDKVVSFILSLYQPDGSFITDKYGELDLRFNYCAVQSMALLGKLEELDGDQIAKYICSCQNIDGGLLYSFPSLQDSDPFREQRATRAWFSAPSERSRFYTRFIDAKSIVFVLSFFRFL